MRQTPCSTLLVYVYLPPPSHLPPSFSSPSMFHHGGVITVETPSHGNSISRTRTGADTPSHVMQCNIANCCQGCHAEAVCERCHCLALLSTLWSVDLPALLAYRPHLTPATARTVSHPVMFCLSPRPPVHPDPRLIPVKPSHQPRFSSSLSTTPCRTTLVAGTN